MGLHENKKSYLMALSMGISAAVIICFINEIFAVESAQKAFKILSDAFFIPGVFLLGVGILLSVVNEGLFNGIIFGLKTLGRSFVARKGEKIREEEFHEYNKRMKEKKTSVAHFIVVGIGFILISAVFAMLYV